MSEGTGADFSAGGFKEALSSTQGKIAIVTGVAVVGWWWYRNKSGSASTSTTSATGSAGVADTSSLGGVDTPSGSGGYSYDGSGGNVGNGNVTTDQSNIPTNATWAQNAINYLSGTLGQDASTVASALGAYLSGQPLTTAQQGIVTTAIGVTGQPPTQVPVSTGMTGTNPSGGTTTVTGGSSTTATGGGSATHKVTVTKGETQKELITAAGETYAQFLQDNPTYGTNGKSNGKKVTTGATVTLR